MRDKTKATCPTCQSPFKDERWCAVWKDSGANKQEPHELVSAGLCAACTDSWHEGASQAEAPATWCCDGNGSSYGHAPTCRYSQPDYAQSAIPEAPPCHCDPGDGLYPGGFEADCPVHGGVGAAEAPKPDLANDDFLIAHDDDAEVGLAAAPSVTDEQPSLDDFKMARQWMWTVTCICGKKKLMGHGFCDKCFSNLEPQLKSRIYRMYSRSFVSAYTKELRRHMLTHKEE